MFADSWSTPREGFCTLPAKDLEHRHGEIQTDDMRRRTFMAQLIQDLFDLIGDRDVIARYEVLQLGSSGSVGICPDIIDFPEPTGLPRGPVADDSRS